MGAGGTQPRSLARLCISVSSGRRDITQLCKESCWMWGNDSLEALLSPGASCSRPLDGKQAFYISRLCCTPGSPSSKAARVPSRKSFFLRLCSEMSCDSAGGRGNSLILGNQRSLAADAASRLPLRLLLPPNAAAAHPQTVPSKDQLYCTIFWMVLP